MFCTLSKAGNNIDSKGSNVTILTKEGMKMTYKDLPKYIEALDKKGLMKTIECEVDSDLEITEIADRVSKDYGPGLLFNNVKGSPYPLAINVMGTYERLEMGFGVNNLDEVADEIENFMDLSRYATWVKKFKAIPKLAPLAFVFPRKVKKAPCQEVIEAPNLDELPILKCWPEDGGRYITLPLVFTKDPDNGQQNVGMYRLQVYDKKTTGMHWHLHKDGKEIYEKYRKLGKRMPVSVALGCDPATIYAATAPMPKMIDEMIFAGYLKKRPIELVKCVTNEIHVPAHAEFILEGYVDLDELRLEGPFGDHTGYYSLADMYPVFHIEKVTRKKNPIYPTTIVGKPPMEDCYLGKATERIFLPLMKIQCPEVVDMNFPLEGVFHNCVIVSMKKAFPKHGNKTLYALWGLGQMMYTKMIILVDESINVHDYSQVIQAIDDNVYLEEHVLVTEGPLDALDHASNKAFQGYRLGVDATIKKDNECPPKDEVEATSDPKHDQGTLDAFIKSEAGVVAIVFPHKALLKKLAIIVIEKKSGIKGHSILEKIIENNILGASKLAIVVDKNISPEDYSTVSWKVFNNIDANRDIVISKQGKAPLFIGIDATKKTPEDGLMRPWPNDIEMTDEIKTLVDERWSTYGID